MLGLGVRVAGFATWIWHRTHMDRSRKLHSWRFGPFIQGACDFEVQ
jgi:hypothetical protein